MNILFVCRGNVSRSFLAEMLLRYEVERLKLTEIRFHIQLQLSSKLSSTGNVMLKIRVLVVDRTRSPFLKEGESFYLERLRRYASVEWIEVKPAKMTKGRMAEEILAEEGQNLGRRLMPGDYLVTLDRTGRPYASEELAGWLDGLSGSSLNWIDFVIGGPLGLPEEMLKRAHKVLSLSRLTLTHEMSRLVLLEQLYRAFTIMRGEKYHK